MPGVDLSDYAGLFILGIFAINVVIANLVYKMNGKKSAIASGTLAVLGIWIGFGIVKVMNFDDATPETFITIGVFSTLFSIIYIVYIFAKWLDNRKFIKLQQKQIYYQNELKKLEQEIVDRNHIYHLIQLINCCGCNTEYFEKRNEFSDMSQITNEIKKKKAQLNDISSQIMAWRNSI